MLYVIHGKDTAKARHKLTEMLGSLQQKRPDASLFRVTQENWNDSILDELLGGRGLFSTKYIIVLDGLLSSASSSESIIDQLEVLANSEHIAVMIEEKVSAPYLKKLEKSAEKIQEFELKEIMKREAPASFDFADAFAQRDTKKAWVLFQDIMSTGTAAEEIHGILWWQMKSVFLAKNSGSIKESGLSPYVHQKSSRAAAKWNGPELDICLNKLVEMYHSAHRGEIDFMIELEKLSLSGISK
jgi:DNA polymerase III delta subunit